MVVVQQHLAAGIHHDRDPQLGAKAILAKLQQRVARRLE